MSVRSMALAAAMLGSIMVASAPAQAAYIVNIVQVGSDVVATGSGSIILPTRTVGGSLASGRISPAKGILLLGSGSGQVWFQGPTHSFGSGSATISATSTSGAVVGFSGDVLVIPFDYVSGTDLGVSTATFANTTLAQIGAAVGTYNITIGTGVTADTFTINVGPLASAVPEPATWGMMILGFGMVGAAMRRRGSEVAFG